MSYIYNAYLELIHASTANEIIANIIGINEKIPIFSRIPNTACNSGFEVIANKKNDIMANNIPKVNLLLNSK